MIIPTIYDWESQSGWCRRVAHQFGMTDVQAEAMEEMRRQSYIQGVNDTLEQNKMNNHLNEKSQ